MSGILPTKPLAATRINPKISLFYGLPKVGKTTQLAGLPNCLILDTEGGAEAVEALRIPIRSVDGATTHAEDGTLLGTSAMSFYRAMGDWAVEAMKTNGGKKPKPPYKFLAIDTLDKFEDFCEVSATVAYKRTTIGKNFDGNSVLELPQGGGYYYLRQEVMKWIDIFATLCEHLILVSHIKEKLLNKGGIEVTQKDINLTGKLGSMVAAKADAIGYMYRNEKNELWVNFQTQEGSVMGARYEHLAGKKMPFDWGTIFLEAAATSTGETAK